jgi:predicted NUDIX family NTP pyrophosphohydrolase
VKESAGILLFRRRHGRLEVLLVHPGGPFWKNKDAGAWTIPKGEIAGGEDPLACARREFEEETGSACTGDARALPPVKQKGGKLVRAWAVEGDFDPSTLESHTFTMEWPPASGTRQTFPEVDRAEWMPLEQASIRINAAQAGLLDRLQEILKGHR